MPFTFIVEDPSGNSYISNPQAPTRDPYCKITKYIRSSEEYTAMGYPVDQSTLQAEADRLALADPNNQAIDSKFKLDGKKAKAQTKEEQEALLEKAKQFATTAAPKKEAVISAGGVDFGKSVEDQDKTNSNLEQEVMKFPTPCSNCDHMGNVQMCQSSIPFFKEIIIMAFICDFCGYRNSEIKEGGGISEKAKRITLQVKKDSDLSRDLFKSDTAKFTIQELGFDMEPGSMGSVYTTVEGLLVKLIEELSANNPFGAGDSAMDHKFLDFLAKLEEMKDGKTPFTLVLDDPNDNCFVYNPHAPDADPQITVELYDRTEEQNDELGITQMKVDDYEE
jgi:zinc finger protein